MLRGANIQAFRNWHANFFVTFGKLPHCTPFLLSSFNTSCLLRSRIPQFIPLPSSNSCFSRFLSRSSFSFSSLRSLQLYCVSSSQTWLLVLAVPIVWFSLYWSLFLSLFLCSCLCMSLTISPKHSFRNEILLLLIFLSFFLLCFLSLLSAYLALSLLAWWTCAFVHP